jgi:hypothetical protein
MSRLLSELITHIGRSMSTVAMVDEDCGQLEALQYGEDQYPITFPCILIGSPEVEWKNFKSEGQRGKGEMSVRLAFDCYGDTHYGSGKKEGRELQDDAEERAEIAHLLNTLLEGWGCDCAGPLRRVRSRGVSLPRQIKVYETVYEVTVVDVCPLKVE